MKRIATVVGARPQFIKAAVVSRMLQATPGVAEVLIHTGQHYDAEMSQQFFAELAIREPDFNLGIGSASHGHQTGRMMMALENVFAVVRPDVVLVYGDTNSTLAGALVAAKLGIPVAHVEAGLRSFNRAMPEEINRVLTDHVAALLFAPTEAAVANLQREGINGPCVKLVGDVMFDAALYYGEQAERQSSILHRLGLHGRDYILLTVHRAENTDDATRLSNIFRGMARFGRKVPVVVPLHPRTRGRLEQVGFAAEAASYLHIMPPVGYLDMTSLERHATLIVTDSGGVQKEAYFHGVPCVTLRDETEWVELVEAGWNRLLPPTDPEIVAETLASIYAEVKGGCTPPQKPLYGDGSAAEKIAHYLLDAL